jgi:NitT/TauT family transport system ATP-binding protein
MMHAFLEVQDLHVEFGEQQRLVAIDSISFVVERGDFVSIVGPSGCGKTTLLRCIGGLSRPTRGRILLEEKEVLEPPRGVVMVFQDYSKSLLPWRRVLGNVTLGLESIKNLSSAERVERARRYLDAVNIRGFEDYYPGQLSGGMQQRVAIARALAFQPDVLLMDEPFASVDAQTRNELEDMLLNIWEQFNQTILFITHDIEEAIYLATKIVVISARPSKTLDTISVELGKKRDQLLTRENQQFLELRHRVYRTIKNERNLSHGRG